MTYLCHFYKTTSPVLFNIQIKSFRLYLKHFGSQFLLHAASTWIDDEKITIKNSILKSFDFVPFTEDSNSFLLEEPSMFVTLYSEKKSVL